MCHHPLETDLGGKRLLLQDNLTSLEKAREENGDLTARLQKKCQEIQGGSEKTCPFSPGAKEIRKSFGISPSFFLSAISSSQLPFALSFSFSSPSHTPSCFSFGF